MTSSTKQAPVSNVSIVRNASTVATDLLGEFHREPEIYIFFLIDKRQPETALFVGSSSNPPMRKVLLRRGVTCSQQTYQKVQDIMASGSDIELVLVGASKNKREVAVTVRQLEAKLIEAGHPIIKNLGRPRGSKVQS